MCSGRNLSARLRVTTGCVTPASGRRVFPDVSLPFQVKFAMFCFVACLCNCHCCVCVCVCVFPHIRAECSCVSSVLVYSLGIKLPQSHHPVFCSTTATRDDFRIGDETFFPFSGDGTVRVWDSSKTYMAQMVIPAHQAEVLTCDWSKYDQVQKLLTSIIFYCHEIVLGDPSVFFFHSFTRHRAAVPDTCDTCFAEFAVHGIG